MAGFVAKGKSRARGSVSQIGVLAACRGVMHYDDQLSLGSFQHNFAHPGLMGVVPGWS